MRFFVGLLVGLGLGFGVTSLLAPSTPEAPRPSNP
jgi:hypothetical protein